MVIEALYGSDFYYHPGGGIMRPESNSLMRIQIAEIGHLFDPGEASTIAHGYFKREDPVKRFYIRAHR